MLSKKLKKGFMSVETVIVGFIILSAGFSGIMMLSNTGKETVNNKIAQLEEVDGIEKIENGFIFA